VKNRMREICTSGSVRGGAGDIPTYSAARSRTQHLCDLRIAKAAVPTGLFSDVGGQPFLIVWPSRNTPLGGPMLSKHPADPALRQSQLASNVVDAGAAAGGA
jgi:hypothetical protein